MTDRQPQHDAVLAQNAPWQEAPNEHGANIYAVEAHYRRLLDKQPVVIILDAGGGQCTLMRADKFLGHNLEELYVLLNDLDPNAKALDNRWGGSTDIGGSPRKTGTTLAGAQLLRAVETVYGGGLRSDVVAILRERGARAVLHLDPLPGELQIR